MRVTFLTVALILAAACSLERGVSPAPNPQKSALRSRCLAIKCGSPMLVLDGRVVDFDTADLDPHDIALIEIMKGDSAVVKFGEKARSGVVIVTSKKPR